MPLPPLELMPLWMSIHACEFGTYDSVQRSPHSSSGIDFIFIESRSLDTAISKLYWWKRDMDFNDYESICLLSHPPTYKAEE
jgi:hypothetical protein